MPHSRRKHEDDPHHDLAGALHDVSNALTVVLGWAREAQENEASPQFVNHALELIERRARAARDLARRAIGASVEVASENTTLISLLDETVESLAIEATRAGVQLVVEHDDSAVHIPSAADFSQVLVNLVLNALQHSAPAGAVHIQANTDANLVRVDVRDQGPGIAQSRRAQVFEGNSNRVGGSGVGLRHARALARAAGGEIEVVPSAVGACLRVTWALFPVKPPSSRVVPGASGLAGLRVLIVEDDRDVTTLLETALTARGVETTIVRRSRELAPALRKKHDAVLLDLSPIANDVEGFLRSIHKSSPNAAVILITGSTGDLPKVGAGVELQCVQKPFEMREIVAALLASQADRG